MKHYIFEAQKKLSYQSLFTWDKLNWFIAVSNDNSNNANNNGATNNNQTQPSNDKPTGDNSGAQQNKDNSDNPVKFDRTPNSVVNGIPTDSEGKYDFSSYYPDLKKIDKKNLATYGSIAINPEKQENQSLLYGVDNNYDGRGKIFNR